MKRALLLVAAVLLLAGCVSDPSTVAVGPPESGATTLAPAPGGSDDRPGPPGAPAPGISGGGPGPETTVPAPASASPAPPVGGVGSAARHLLQASGARQIVVQAITHAGAEPRQGTLDRLVSVLSDASGKPVSTAGGSVDAPRASWTAADLRSAADAAAFAVDDGTFVVRILFVGGRAEQGEGVLGIATSGDVAAVFSDQVEAAATGLVSPATIERAVAVHELGHLLGLVDLVLATGRADPEHPGHSGNRRSVMYWAVESSLVGDLLAGGPPQRFDDDDLADLAAIRRG